MMEPSSTGRACPKCGSTDYLFRGRKKVSAEPGKPEAVETKYRCRACGHEWEVRVGAKGEAEA
jgi:DNA-directed RNA polymerase subunit M/transcription elongation factor TFIIS